ncbi:hypothetical protein OH77DRAFT_217649 [Trametes cingulata]|nr:hypothetical protein OH77DRAFT_217649 [Trametes cingulata]
MLIIALCLSPARMPVGSSRPATDVLSMGLWPTVPAAFPATRYPICCFDFLSSPYAGVCAVCGSWVASAGEYVPSAGCFRPGFQPRLGVRRGGTDDDRNDQLCKSASATLRATVATGWNYIAPPPCNARLVVAALSRNMVIVSVAATVTTWSSKRPYNV